MKLVFCHFTLSFLHRLNIHSSVFLFLPYIETETLFQMNPEGFVHMSVISRFNRVRALTQDIVAIKEAMVGSTVVEMAPGQKVLPISLTLCVFVYTLC